MLSTMGTMGADVIEKKRAKILLLQAAQDYAGSELNKWQNEGEYTLDQKSSYSQWIDQKKTAIYELEEAAEAIIEKLEEMISEVQ